MLVDVIESYDKQKKEFLLNLWDKVVKSLSSKHDPKKIVSFLNKCGIVGIDEKKQHVYIGTPNEFIKSQVHKFFHKELNEAIQEEYSYNFSVKFIIYQKFQSGRHGLQLNLKKTLGVNNNGDKPSNNKKIDKSTKENLKEMFGVLFDTKYNFSNFIVGSYNELAYSGAVSIAEKPGQVYNPFFIYGDVGLGKTHLLQAIGNYTIKNNKDKIVVYLPTTKLIDEIVEGIKKNNLSNLMKKLENVDILIIDDIQFLAGKDKTQEIFYNIFNEFHIQNKQIILSSDRPPKDINLLENRLKSRFSLGLVADVKEPDFETRLAILQSKLKERGEQISLELLEIIAKTVTDNIRELEGAINLILTKKNLLNKELNEKDIYESLETLGYKVDQEDEQQAAINNADNMNSKNSKSFGKIVEYVANYYDISIYDIKGDSRKKDVSLARQMLMYIAKNHFERTFEKIGDYFGGKNHASVIYAVNNFKKMLKNNKKAFNDYNTIIKEFK